MLVLIVFSPLLHGVENGAQAFSEWCEAVGDAARGCASLCAVYDAICLHSSQAFCEYFGADAVEAVAQFGEALRLSKQVADDQQFPFVPNQLYCGANGAFGVYICFRSHVAACRAVLCAVS